MFQEALRNYGLQRTESGSAQQEAGMHWLPYVERKGVLGSLLKRVNHYAITVSDVGKSLEFYTNVLGLQQIRRPNFDRHGAWLTGGNLEIHLILGPPAVPETDSLIVGHLSFESDDILECRRRLVEGDVEFTQNVSVPNKDQSAIVTQFFLRDPDGYYIEICNCDILTKFCLSRDFQEGLAYNETSVSVSLAECLQLLKRASWAKGVRKERLLEKPHDLILPPSRQAKVPSRQKLQNMLKRAKVWGDIMQGETTESIATALKQAGNNVPLATRIIRAKKAGEVHYEPPAVYKGGEHFYQPEKVAFSARKAVLDAAGFDKAYVDNPEERYRVLFNMLDKEGTGQISLAATRDLIGKMCSGAVVAGDKVNDMFADLAKQEVESLDWDAFVTLCEKEQQYESAERWELIFDLCDDDGNGVLQAPELCHKLADLGMAMTDAEMDEIFLEADQSGDGVLTKQEFAAFMTALPLAQWQHPEGPHAALTAFSRSFAARRRSSAAPSGSFCHRKRYSTCEELDAALPPALLNTEAHPHDVYPHDVSPPLLI